MPVHCATCGEELLGSVNRCWKCGNQFEALAEDGLPPIIRAPVPSDTQPVEDDVPVADVVEDFTVPKATAAETTKLVSSRQGLRLGFAVSSIVIGGFSLLASFFTPFAAIGAAIGIALGVFALVGGNRAAAIAGIILCCLALTVSGVRMSVEAGKYMTTPAEELEDSF